MRTLVALSIAVFTVLWVNRGRRKKRDELCKETTPEEPAETCPRCGGPGTVSITGPMGHPTGTCRHCHKCNTDFDQKWWDT